MTFEFAIDATTGALTRIGTTAIAGTTTTMAVEPSGRFAYNGVMYAIDSNSGILAQVNAPAVTTPTVVDLSGQFAYSPNDAVSLPGAGVTGYSHGSYHGFSDCDSWFTVLGEHRSVFGNDHSENSIAVNLSL